MKSHSSASKFAVFSLTLAAIVSLAGALAGPARAGEAIWMHPRLASLQPKTASDHAALNACERQARSFGRADAAEQLGGGCLDLYLQAADPAAVKQSSDGSTLVFGHRNLVVVRRFVQVEGALSGVSRRGEDAIIGGPTTDLRGITAISVDFELGLIFVLNEGENTILTYPLVKSSSGGPALRRIVSPKLKGAVALTVDRSVGELYVANKSSGSVLVFGETDGASDPFLSPVVSPRREIRSASLVSPAGIAFDPVHLELYVADSTVNQIVVFDSRASGNVSPRRAISGHATGIRSPWGVSYLESGQVYVQLNPAGSAVFDRAADGDAAPLSHSE